MQRLIKLILVLSGLLLIAPGASAKPPVSQDDISLPKPAKKKKKPAYSVKRGQLLYENHCQSCHSSMVHIRKKRKASNVSAIRSWVVHWSSHLKLSWSDSEIDEVVHYLNTRHYHYKK